MQKQIELVNRKAKFEFHLMQSFEAGIMLLGTEVKSVKLGNANLNDAYCVFQGGELFIKNMHISEYKHGNIQNHDTKRDRKLLLKKAELRKLDRRVKEKSMTIVPYRIYLSERGYIKIEIYLAQGKRAYDKRESIKARESKRELDRMKKRAD